MARVKAHVIETASKDYLRSKIDSYYQNGDALVRGWDERDYGIDLVIEFFEDGCPTGNMAYLQIKATENTIAKNKRTDDVSCNGVSACSLEYAKQNKIPFILIYISLAEPKEFYFIDIQSLDVNKLLKSAQENSRNSTTVRIPHVNRCGDDISGLMKLIRSYF